ncbi:MAG: hypothetical protein S4CHLAM6_15030 [Chlamydiae bacterium]|nr:hypothetical protein [Chlamydiota bacterium]
MSLGAISNCATSCELISLQPLKESGESVQSKFSQAIQKWDLVEVLNLLNEGNINPHVLIIPEKSLAKKLMKIDEKLHLIREGGDEFYLEAFIRDSEMPSWILLSLFTLDSKDQGLRIQILDRLNDVIDFDFDNRFEKLYLEVARVNEFENTQELKAFFKAIYLEHIKKWKSDYSFRFDDIYGSSSDEVAEPK